MCTVCKQQKLRQMFSCGQSKVQRCDVCRTCQDCGLFFSNNNYLQATVPRCKKCVVHHCTGCGMDRYALVAVKNRHLCKAKEFETKRRWNDAMKSSTHKKFVCKSCQDPKLYQCSAPPCMKKKPRNQYPAHAFDEAKILDAERHGRAAQLFVCNNCTAAGFTDRRGGLEPFRCARCAKVMGHKNFDTRALANKKRRPDSTLYCVNCRPV